MLPLIVNKALNLLFRLIIVIIIIIFIILSRVSLSLLVLRPLLAFDYFHTYISLQQDISSAICVYWNLFVLSYFQLNLSSCFVLSVPLFFFLFSCFTGELVFIPATDGEVAIFPCCLTPLFIT
jgi:hypothetical protein